MSRSQEFYESQKAHRYFGSNNIDHLFPEGKPVTVVPWEQMGRRKDRQDYDRQRVHDLLSKPPQEHEFEHLDPRDLHATQPGIVRAGVQHYLGDEYRRTGQTYADQDVTGNRHPVVYRRESLTGGAPQNLLLSGHHRAAAALLQGQQFRARVVEGPWGPMRGEGPPSLTRQTPRWRSL